MQSHPDRFGCSEAIGPQTNHRTRIRGIRDTSEQETSEYLLQTKRKGRYQFQRHSNTHTFRPRYSQSYSIRVQDPQC